MRCRNRSWPPSATESREETRTIGKDAKKIWNDVSIEAIDVLIMAADIALTIPPNCTLTNEEWRLHLRHALTRKLRKWSEQLDENKTIT